MAFTSSALPSMTPLTALQRPGSQARRRAEAPLAIKAPEAIAMWRRKQVVMVDLSDWETADQRGWIEGSFHCPPGEFAGLVDPASPLHTRLFEPGKVFIFYGGPKAAPLKAAKRARALGLSGARALRGGLAAWRNAGGRIAGHPNSPFPALKASFNITLKYALAALRRRYAKFRRRGGQTPRSA